MSGVSFRRIDGWVMNLGSFTGGRVVNEAFLEARKMSSGKVGGERGARQGANEQL